MKILHIDCSPRTESHSRKLSAAIVARLVALDPSASTLLRDLGRAPIPHHGSDYSSALSSHGTLSAVQTDDAFHQSEQLIQEVESADILVIGTPMNNFTVPSVLKAWIDQVLRMGRTIGASPTGRKYGLLQDRPVFIGIASGGVFTGDRAMQPNFLVPYLKAVFECIGLHSLQFFPLQATAFLDHDQLAAVQDTLLAKIDMAMVQDIRRLLEPIK